MQLSVERGRVKYLIDAPPLGGVGSALLASIRLGCLGLNGTNNLAYLYGESVTKIKKVNITKTR